MRLFIMDTKDKFLLKENDEVDPVVLESFNDIKAAIISNRTDIVRHILSTAQSLREEDFYDSDGEERDRRDVINKYDNEEYVDLLSLLLSHLDTDSGTLLHHATRMGYADIVRALLSAGSNVLLKNKDGKNPYEYCSTESVKNAYIGELLQAVSQSRIFRVDQLLRCGIEVNSTDGAISGNTVLHWAASYGDAATVRLILDNGANVDELNSDGQTPLHDALKRRDLLIIEELLKQQPNVYIKPFKGCFEGVSCLDIMLKNAELNELLERYILLAANNVSETKSSSGNDHATFEKNHSIKQNAFKPLQIEVDPIVKLLCPQPQKVKQFKGLYFVPPKDLVVFVKRTDVSVYHIVEVVHLFKEKQMQLGSNLIVELSWNGSMIKYPYVECMVNKMSFTKQEEYFIQINTQKILLAASSLESLYRGLCTLFQCFKLFRGKAVPLLQISDWATCIYRGIILDFHQNDFPLWIVLQELIDLFSLFKINELQINVSHIDQESSNARFTPSDFFKLQLFCQKRFITVSPYINIDELPLLLSTNGSDLLNLIYLEYLLQPFIKPKCVHVNVGVSQNFKLVKDFHNYCNQQGILLHLTAEMINFQFDHMSVMLNGVCYSSDIKNEENLNEVNSFGFQQSLCINDELMTTLFPDSSSILTKVQHLLRKHSSSDYVGMFVKLSLKNKKICSLTSCFPTLLVIASLSWNNLTSDIDEDHFSCVIDNLIYGDNADGVGQLYMLIGKTFSMFKHSAESKSLIDEFLESTKISCISFDTDSLQVLCKSVSKMKKYIKNVQLNSALSNMVVDETVMLCDLVYFVCRFLFCILNAAAKVDLPDVTNLPLTQRSDNANKLISLMQKYEVYVEKYYLSPPHGFTSVYLLKQLLNKLLSAGLSESPLTKMVNGLNI